MTRIERSSSRMDVVALRLSPTVPMPSLSVPPAKRPLTDLRLVEVAVHRSVVNGSLRRLSVVLGLGSGTLTTQSVTYSDLGAGTWSLPLSALPDVALVLLAKEPIWTDQRAVSGV
jgi:hypothetical protein